MNPGNSIRIFPHHYLSAYQLWALLLFSLSSTISFGQITKEWDKTFGGALNEEATSIQQTTDGGYIVSGLSVSNISGDVTEISRGGSDYWLLKLDGSGNKVWDKRYGGNSFEFSQSVIQTYNGGYLLGGWSPSNISGEKSENIRGFWGTDYWIVKTDANGNLLWDKTFGGAFNDQLWEVKESPNSDTYVLGGLSDSNADNDKSDPSFGGFDFWVIKTDSSGTKLWDKTYGGSGTDMLFAIEYTSDGGLIMGGLSDSGINGSKSEASRGSFDFWVVKTDVNGNILWDKTYGGDGNDQLYSIQQTIDGGYILGGWSQSGISGDKTQANQGGSDFWVIKINASGVKQWDRTFGGSGKEELRIVRQNQKGNYILGGYSDSNISGDKSQNTQGFDDFWVVAIDANGNFVYDYRYGGSSKDNLYSLALTSDNGYVMAGISASGASGDKTGNSRGGNDSWIVKVACDPHTLITGDSIICQGETTTLDASTSPFACSYHWEDGNTNATRNLSPLITTKYYLTVTDVHGCDHSDSITVEVLPLPIIELGNDTAFCQGNSITLDAANTRANFNWTSGETTQTISANATGLYEVTVTEANGCSQSDQINIIVNPLPTVELGNDTAFCQGNSITLDAANTRANFNWTSGETTQTISANATGLYEVTVTEANGCSQSDQINIIVNPLPTVELGNDTAFCQGNSITLDAANTRANFNWTSGETTQTISANATGFYEVTVTNANGCSQTDQINIIVNPLPTVELGNDTAFCQGNAIILDAGNTGANFNWASGETTQTISVNATGFYEVTVTDANGCSQIDQINITVNPIDTSYIELTSCDPNQVGMTTLNLTNQFGCDSIIFQNTTLIDSDSTFIQFSSCNPLDIGLTTQILSNQNGCDSLIFTQVNFNAADTSFVKLTSCDPNQVGMTTLNLTNQFGCDSIIFQNTTLLDSDSTFIQLSSCNPLDIGLTTQILSNQNGCDSLIFTQVNFNAADTSFVKLTSCDPNQVGMTTLNLVNQFGCDSIVFQNTTLLDSDSTFIQFSSCNPLDIGLTTQILSNQNGCDSLIFTQVNFNAADTSFVKLTSCDPNQVGMTTLNLTNQFGCDSIVFQNTTLIDSDSTFIQLSSCNPLDTGLTTQILSNQNGCDSLIFTQVNFNAADTSFVELTSCDPNQVGMTTLNLTNQFGCDSIVFQNTTLLDSDSTFIQFSSCNPLDIGLTTQILSNQNGCDSLIFTQVNLNAADTSFVELTSCDPNQVGMITLNLTNQFGCDSIIFQNTTLLDSDSTFIQLSSCNPLDTGLTTQILSNQNGCDSLIFTQVNFNAADTSFVKLTSCDPNQVGMTTLNLTNQFGCDSIVFQNTTLLDSDSTFIQLSTCNPLDTGLTTQILSNQNGCDSLIFTQVNLNAADTSFVELTSCDPNQVGMTTLNLINQFGCDSIVFQNTTLIDSDSTFIQLSSCNPLDIGLTIQTLPNQNGCDSLIFTTTLLEGCASDTTFLIVENCDPTMVGSDTIELSNQLGFDSIVVVTINLLPSDTTLLTLMSCSPLRYRING